jgi:hypothetical protein
MDQEKVWKLPATLFIVGMLAMLLAGAWRDLEAKARPAPVVGLPAVEQPDMGEPLSNEVNDWIQLD